MISDALVYIILKTTMNVISFSFSNPRLEIYQGIPFQLPLIHHFYPNAITSNCQNFILLLKSIPPYFIYATEMYFCFPFGVHRHLSCIDSLYLGLTILISSSAAFSPDI